MGDLYQLPDVRQAEREASEWIARLQADDVSADDRERFEAWRAAHPERAAAYERLMGTWRQFAAAGPFVRAVSFAQSVSDPALSAPRPNWTIVALAASVLLAVAVVLHFALPSSGARFSTAVGEQITVSLPDGSMLKLNSNSMARVDYRRDSRVIHLEQGEAFFKVAHDTHRPFWVVGGQSWVRAVGTEFDVHVRGQGVQVTVNEGVVKVGHMRSVRSIMPTDAALASIAASVLNAGQQAELQGELVKTKGLSANELAHSISWRDGLLYFENKTLGEVVDEIGRYTPVELVIDDEKLRDLVVGGTFRANPQGAEAFLAMLDEGLGLNVRRDGERAYIESRPQ